jgi:hypothetical protein
MLLPSQAPTCPDGVMFGQNSDVSVRNLPFSITVSPFDVEFGTIPPAHRVDCRHSEDPVACRWLAVAENNGKTVISYTRFRPGPSSGGPFTNNLIVEILNTSNFSPIWTSDVKSGTGFDTCTPNSSGNGANCVDCDLDTTAAAPDPTGGSTWAMQPYIDNGGVSRIVLAHIKG